MDTEHQSTTLPYTKPERTIGQYRFAAIVFFTIAGGAYGLEPAIKGGGAAWTLLGILIIPWIWSMPMALMTAELSTAMPGNAGYVGWSQRAFGNFWAWLTACSSFLAGIFDLALYPLLFLSYGEPLLGKLPPVVEWTVLITFVAILTMVNVRGLELVGSGAIILAVMVLLPFFVFFVAGVTEIRPAVWISPLPKGYRADWALLLSTLLWNLSGADSLGCVAGEVEDPKQTYPRGMIMGLGAVSLSYVLPVMVAVCVDTNYADWDDGYFLTIARLLSIKLGGPQARWLQVWLSIAGMCASVGMFNVTLPVVARAFACLGDLRMLPPVVSILHKTWATPWVSLLIISISVIVCLLLPDFDALVQLDVFTSLFSLIIEFLAFVYLRISHPDMERPFLVPGGLTGAFMVAIPPIILCITLISISSQFTILIGSAALVGCAILYPFFVYIVMPHYEGETNRMDLMYAEFGQDIEPERLSDEFHRLEDDDEERVGMEPLMSPGR